MQSLEVSCAVRPIQGSLGVKGLMFYNFNIYVINFGHDAVGISDSFISIPSKQKFKYVTFNRELETLMSVRTDCKKTDHEELFVSSYWPPCVFRTAKSTQQTQTLVECEQ
jgi:hypothetical protein